MIAEIPPRFLRLVVDDSVEEARPLPQLVQTSSETMRSLIGAAKAQGYSSNFIVDALDRRIRRYLETVGQRGEGERNATAFRVARWLVNDFGASESVAWPYLVEWNAGNRPPLTERELRATFTSAQRSGRRPAGCAHDPRRGSAA